MASLSLRHVYKVYPNGKKAVSDFSMEIEHREFIVFVGPSGCGKSTTLRMIAGLEDITTGEVYIDGQFVNDVEPKDRDIAMVFQNYALYPHLSVYENMAFGLKIRRLPREEIHRRVIEAAEILGITEYLAKKPKEMSGGQRQRVALGRAIVREPKVFLLDEPLSNLDAKLRTQMRAEISKLHAKLKTTFIYVTHDQTEAMTMGTRIVVMRDGVIQQVDTPRRLYSEPASMFVASFIGTPQMNFYKVTLQREGERVRITLGAAGAVWEVPYESFLKVRPEYLDGSRPVTLGIRAERIFTKGGDVLLDAGEAVCTVSHVEELGDEALVYGDLSGESERVTESESGIVFKVSAERGMEIRSGDRITVYFDLRHAHFFDCESEVSIRPEIPEGNVLDAESDGRTLRLAEAVLPLPDALCGRLRGHFTAEIPPGALLTSGAGVGMRVRIEACESIVGREITRVSSGERQLFVEGRLGDVGEEVFVRPDYKAITFSRKEETVVSALPTVNRLYGEVIRERDRREKRMRYYFQVADAKYEIGNALLGRLIKTAGASALRKKLRYEFPPTGVTVGAGRLSGVVRENLDYGGGERYAVLTVDGREVVARTDRALEGTVALDLDLEAVTYIDDELDVILL